MFDDLSKDFMDMVQQHERQWGTEQYPRRPSLHSLMTSPVVVFWHGGEDEKRPIMTLHGDLNDIEKHFLRMLFSQQKSNQRRVAAIYHNHKRMTIRSIQIVFAEAEDE